MKSLFRWFKFNFLEVLKSWWCTVAHLQYWQTKTVEKWPRCEREFSNYGRCEEWTRCTRCGRRWLTWSVTMPRHKKGR